MSKADLKKQVTKMINLCNALAEDIRNSKMTKTYRSRETFGVKELRAVYLPVEMQDSLLEDAKGLKRVMDALLESEPDKQASKPCEWCERTANGELYWFVQDAADDLYEADAPQNYCPNCGRRLGG